MRAIPKARLRLLWGSCHATVTSAGNLQLVHVPGCSSEQREEHRYAEEIDEEDEEPYEKSPLTARGSGCGRHGGLVNVNPANLISCQRPRIRGKRLLALDQPLRDIIGHRLDHFVDLFALTYRDAPVPRILQKAVEP